MTNPPIIPDGGRMAGMTDWERILYRFGVVKSDLEMLQELTADETPLSDEIAAHIQFTADDFNRFAREFIEYQYDRDELPSECPVCGEATIPADLDPEPGDELPAEKICIQQASDEFGWDAILHLQHPATTQDTEPVPSDTPPTTN